MTNGWGEPLHIPWDADLLFNILQSPPAVKGAIHCPCTATKPRQLFKTGCLSEASFPSNKQSAKPDFGRQSGSTRVTLFPHPISWSIRAPEGVWAARRWEDWAAVETWGRTPGFRGRWVSGYITQSSVGWRKGLKGGEEGGVRGWHNDVAAINRGSFCALLCQGTFRFMHCWNYRLCTCTILTELKAESYFYYLDENANNMPLRIILELRKEKRK